MCVSITACSQLNTSFCPAKVKGIKSSHSPPTGQLRLRPDPGLTSACLQVTASQLDHNSLQKWLCLRIIIVQHGVNTATYLSLQLYPATFGLGNSLEQTII